MTTKPARLALTLRTMALLALASLIAGPSPFVLAIDPVNTPPTASFTIEPPSGVVGTRFIFDASTSSDPEHTLPWLSIRFDWENDGYYDMGWWNASQTVEHAYTTPGTKTVKMLIKDPDDNTDTTTHTIQVDDPGSNTPPAAICVASPLSGTVDTVFTFSASTSSDAQDAPTELRAKWDWWDSGYWSTDWLPIDGSHDRQWDRHGNHTVRLRIRDTGLLSNDTTCTVEVTPGHPNTAPTASFTITPQTGQPGTRFTFDPSSSSDAEDGIAWLQVRYDWENDGSYDSPWWNASQTLQHQYNVPGQYTVRMLVQDTGDLSNETTRTVTVSLDASDHLLFLPMIGR